MYSFLFFSHFWHEVGDSKDRADVLRYQTSWMRGLLLQKLSRVLESFVLLYIGFFLLFLVWRYLDRIFADQHFLHFFEVSRRFLRSKAGWGHASVFQIVAFVDVMISAGKMSTISRECWLSFDMPWLFRTEAFEAIVWYLRQRSLDVRREF